MYTTILSILPVILFFILGYILNKINFLKQGSVRDFKKVISNLALPALLLMAFASLELEVRFLQLILLVFASCITMIVLGRGAAGILKIPSPYFSLMMGGFEMGMLGYALFLSLYGQEHIGTFALMDLGQIIFVFFVLMTLLLKEKEGTSHPADLLKGFLTSPVILAIFSGVIISLIKPYTTSSPLTDSLRDFLTLLGGVTVPLISLMIGYEMHFDKKGLPLVIKTVLVRKGLLFLLGLVICRFFIRDYMGLDKIYEYALLTMFLLPPPFVIAIYMKQEDKADLDYVNNTLSLGTVVSVLAVMAVNMFY